MSLRETPQQTEQALPCGRLGEGVRKRSRKHTNEQSEAGEGSALGRQSRCTEGLGQAALGPGEQPGGEAQTEGMDFESQLPPSSPVWALGGRPGVLCWAGCVR